MEVDAPLPGGRKTIEGIAFINLPDTGIGIPATITLAPQPFQLKNQIQVRMLHDGRCGHDELLIVNIVAHDKCPRACDVKTDAVVKTMSVALKKKSVPRDALLDV
jgi:hypothetical protein